MANKKILHIIKWLSPTSGAEKQVYNLSLAQKQRGYDVNIIVYNWCSKCKKLVDNGIKIYNINSLKYYSLKSIYLLFKNKTNKTDYFNFLTPTLDFFVFICSYLNKAPFVINERTSYLCFDNFYLKDFQGRLLKTQ